MSRTGLNWTDQHPRFVADLTGARVAKIIGSGNAGRWTTVGSSSGTFQPSQFNTAGLTDWRFDEQPQFFSGHGRADIVGFGNDGVWTALSNGDGTFQPPQLTLADFAPNANGWHADRHLRVLADVTGDGRADIVGFGDDDVWVAVSNGDGTFQQTVWAAGDLCYNQGWRIDEHPRFLADLTGDGRADIVGFGNDGVWTALSNGDGTFQPPQLTLADFAPNANGWHADRHLRVLADVTGDGRADIVGFGDDDVWVAVSNGDGTFQQTVWAAGDLCYNQGWRIDEHPRFLADLTGDGRADIVGFGNDGVWTALSNGDGTFQPPQLTLADFAPNANGWHADRHLRVLADVTGDGRADIVGFGDDDVWVAVSNGDGTFQQTVWAAGDLCYNQGWRIDEHPRFLADLTGDGRTDIVGFGNDGVWTALSNGDGTFQPPQLTLADFGGHSADITEIRHIFVLMLENRSFDHMLGFSGITGSDAATELPTTINGLTGSESNEFHGVTYIVETGAKNVMPHDPGHSFAATLVQLAGYDVGYPPGGAYPPINNSGFATSYGLGVDRDPADAMRCYSETQLPFLHQLAREFVVCDNWFGSMPGPTWPNRLFSHAATSGGLDHTPDWEQLIAWTATPGGGLELSNGTVYDALDRVHGSSPFGSDHYRVYAGDTFPMAATLDGVSIVWDVDDLDDLADDLADGTLEDVKVIHIEPAYHVPGYAFYDEYANGSSQHPLGDVRRGDLLVKQTYEAIRNSPLWDTSMLIITWDEHGGFYDHVPPPAAIPPGDPDYGDDVNQHGFTFDQLGPRVPAVIVSPLIPKNLIDHRVYDHSAIPATIERLFGLDPLTKRDEAANSLDTLIRLRQPRNDTPQSLVTPSGYQMPPVLRITPDDHLTRPTTPVNEGDITPYLYSALAQDLELADPSNHAAIKERAAAIHTWEDAATYMKDVATQVAAARRTRAARPVMPSKAPSISVAGVPPQPQAAART